MTATPVEVDPVDLSTLAFWGRPMAERDASFAELRAERPISWHRPPEGMLMPSEDDPGFWAVVRHADIGYVSKNPKVFCSGQGVQFQDAPAELLEATQSFLAMDAPRHPAAQDRQRGVHAEAGPPRGGLHRPASGAHRRRPPRAPPRPRRGRLRPARRPAAADGDDLRPHGRARGAPGRAGWAGSASRRATRSSCSTSRAIGTPTSSPTR